MKIGIVTTWFERGAAYVSRTYMDLLQNMGHQVYIYARGGEMYAKDDQIWNLPNVTWSKKLITTEVNKKQFFMWISKYELDIVLFNEQAHFEIVAETKKAYPKLKLGAYIDYYTEATLKWFYLYDFVICNTYRHMEALDFHPQRYYLKWGTDINVFTPKNVKKEVLTFFHSSGMCSRKGTDVLVNAFINGELYKNSKLIIHTQKPIQEKISIDAEDLAKYNISVIEMTVSAPGLYHLGDVYVYPTRLDGLGLTIYEALACGLPVITTDYPPMNEPIDESVGKLIKVARNYCRADGYYWPMSICDEEDLIKKMLWYVEHPIELKNQQKCAREKAVNEYDISQRKLDLSDIIEKSYLRVMEESIYKDVRWYYRKERLKCPYLLLSSNSAFVYLKQFLVKQLYSKSY